MVRPLDSAVDDPPDAEATLGPLRRACPRALREIEALRARSHPRAAELLLALDPVLVLDAPLERYARLIEEVLPLAPAAGPRVHAALLRAFARMWGLRGARRVALSALAEANVIVRGAAGEESPLHAGLRHFIEVHELCSVGSMAESERAISALRRAEAGASSAREGQRLHALEREASGMLAMARGAHAVSAEAFEDAIDASRRCGADRTLAIALANHGSVMARQGIEGRARTQLAKGLALFRALGDRVHVAKVEGALLLLDTRRPPDVAALLAATRTSEALGDWREAARLLLATAERSPRAVRRARAPEWLARAWALLARIDAPDLEERARALADERDDTRTLELRPDARVAHMEGRGIDLRARKALPGVLRALVEARLERPGVRLGVAAIFAAGWPGEKALPHAAAARVYMAIRSLRAGGLGVAITTSAEGYRIEPEVRVVFTPAHSLNLEGI